MQAMPTKTVESYKTAEEIEESVPKKEEPIKEVTAILQEKSTGMKNKKKPKKKDFNNTTSSPQTSLSGEYRDSTTSNPFDVQKASIKDFTTFTGSLEQITEKEEEHKTVEVVHEKEKTNKEEPKGTPKQKNLFDFNENEEEDETVVVNRKPSSKKEEIPKATEVKKTVKKNVFEDFDDNGEEEDPIVKKKDSEIKRGTKADPKGKMNFLFED